jgi:hypothetical protein
VGDVAAQDHGVQHVGWRKVTDILTAPAQQSQVLDALNGPSDKGVTLAGLLHPVRAVVYDRIFQ